MIKDATPVADVEQKIDPILEKLDMTAIVPEFGTLAIMILTVAIFASIIVLKKNPYLNMG